MPEESGITVRVPKLAAVWDRRRQRHPPNRFLPKLFFVCELTGGAATTSQETSEVGWFAQADLPQDLSLARVLPQQLNRMFAHWRDPALPTDFDSRSTPTRPDAMDGARSALAIAARAFSPSLENRGARR